MSNSAAASNAALRFRTETVRAPLHSVLLPFSRRASQITAEVDKKKTNCAAGLFAADKKKTICAAGLFAASCLSEIVACTTSSCDTATAIFDLHLVGKLVGILVSNGASAVDTTFRFRSETVSVPLYFVLLSFLAVLLRP